MSITDTGFWADNYGINTFDEFKAATSGIWDSPGALSLLAPLNNALREDAWNFPYSGPGMGTQSYLSAHPWLDTNQPGAASSVISRMLSSIAGLGQEATVPSLVIPNAFQVTIEGVCSGQAVDNVIGVTNPAGTAAGAAAAVKAAWEVSTGPLHYQSNLYSVQNYHAVDLSSSMGTIADLASTGVGGNSTTPTISTMAACALVSWNGTSRSRSTRGRLYYGPLTESQVNADGRTLLAASQAAWVTMFNAFIASLNSASYPLAVLSRTLSTAFPVTTCAVESTIATQRRRIR